MDDGTPYLSSTIKEHLTCLAHFPPEFLLLAPFDIFALPLIKFANIPDMPDKHENDISSFIITDIVPVQPAFWHPRPGNGSDMSPPATSELDANLILLSSSHSGTHSRATIQLRDNNLEQNSLGLTNTHTPLSCNVLGQNQRASNFHCFGSHVLIINPGSGL